MLKDQDRFTGILLGLAVGDALGTMLEFGPRRSPENLHTEMVGGGFFKLGPGQWTDDTAMAVAMGRSLLQEKAFRPLKILNEWAEWFRNGTDSCTGSCFDIGNATKAALNAYLRDPTRVPNISPSAPGNGSLMPLAPVILFASDEEEAATLSYEQSVLTHGEDAARATEPFGRLLFETAAFGLDVESMPIEIRARDRSEVSASGYFQYTLEAALWAVSNTASFEEAVVQAVNLGDDADTVGAVTGQLAGAVYGKGAIPSRWLERLAWRRELEELAQALCSG